MLQEALPLSHSRSGSAASSFRSPAADDTKPSPRVTHGFPTKAHTSIGSKAPSNCDFGDVETGFPQETSWKKPQLYFFIIYILSNRQSGASGRDVLRGSPALSPWPKPTGKGHHRAALSARVPTQAVGWMDGAMFHTRHCDFLSSPLYPMFEAQHQKMMARPNKTMGKRQALHIYYSDDVFYSIRWV